MDEDFRKAALDYHRLPRPGKLSVEPTKRMATQRDLSLAYSPGVAAACEEIAANPDAAWDYTVRGNMVAVVSNGTAVLGLGAIGALASKPVMEGKAVLFRKFAGIDSIDIEIEERDPDKLVEIVAALEPSFGAINLEDIKAPECFEVEQRLRDRMSIPVFHDDQHGTAIIVAAAVRNGLQLQGKRLETVKLVNTGGGAAALAALDLLVAMGLPRENIWICDIHGLVFEGRQQGMDPYKARYAQKTKLRTLEEVIEGADIFLGLSAPRVLKPEWLPKLAAKPLVLALANPEPEILPEAVRAARPDAIVATGRSDYANQVNNVLCFPFIFRGALDVGATAINEAMKVAAADAIAALARVEASEVVAAAYGGQAPVFGPDYIIPKPFDPRLILEIAPAVARAAMQTGVARRPVADFDAYRRDLERFVFRSGYLMRPLFEAARRQRARRVVYAEGEDERTLRAVQTVLDEGIAEPVLLGRREVIEARAKAMGLRMDFSQSVHVLDPARDRAIFDPLIDLYTSRVDRRGVPPEAAARRVATRPTVAAALLLEAGQADAALVGGSGNWMNQWHYAFDIIGMRADVSRVYALSAVIVPNGTLFFVDTHLLLEPTPEQICEMTLLAAEQVHAFGLVPKAALLSHSSFGQSHAPTARTMRKALALIRSRAPGLEADGEMHGDAALVPAIRARAVSASTLTDTANLLVFPTLDAANIAFNLVKAVADGLQVGPILLGMRRPVHVLVPSVTARGIANLTALAVAQANEQRG
jgi:malate dehydrogenase (oxaloacetate-decarboxylating)(NADP+)